ncbi:MAG: hypothetical protein ACXWEL_04150 [Solirubrobacterales bacterium]
MSRLPRIALAAALAVGLLGLAGCKINETKLDDIEEGQTFKLGELRFNALFDRFLNGQQVEDRDYLGDAPPVPEGKTYFGVFLLVKNPGEEDEVLPARESFKITDTTGAEFTPLPTQSLYEFPYGETIPAHAEVPDPDSVPANGPIQGALVMFEIDQAATENRPLEFHIDYGGEEAVVRLDL